MGRTRTPCCEKEGLKKGPWTPEEDHKLLAFIDAHGHGSWHALPSKAGLQRCGKSCRLRWTNYLRPDIKRGKFNPQEEQTIIQLHALLGNRWSAIASQLPKRTDNEIKNFWNTRIKKRLTKLGIDPITHKRRTTGALGSGEAKNVANLSHMAQWENARLQAEARLVREAKLVANNPSQLPPQQNSSTSSGQLVCRPIISSTLEPLMLRRRPGLHYYCLDHVLKAWQGITLDIKGFHGAPNTLLESPTSTLNFSHSVGNFLPNQALRPALANNYDGVKNLRTGMTMENSIEACNANNDISQYMEGLTDLVDGGGDDIDGHNYLTDQISRHDSGGNFEEKWNNILNDLANFSPSGSPVFDPTQPNPTQP